MAPRNHAEKKQFKQRKDGIMKKMDQLRKLCGVKAFVFIQDGMHDYAYTSHRNWPLGVDIKGATILSPEDFTTLREASLNLHPTVEEEVTATPESSSRSSPDLGPQLLNHDNIHEVNSSIVQNGQLPAWNETNELSDLHKMDQMCQRQLQPLTWAAHDGNNAIWPSSENVGFPGNNPMVLGDMLQPNQQLPLSIPTANKSATTSYQLYRHQGGLQVEKGSMSSHVIPQNQKSKMMYLIS